MNWKEKILMWSIHQSPYLKFLNLYEKESVVHGKSMKFRNMGSVEGNEDVKAEDLMNLLKFGLNVGLSDANRDEKPMNDPIQE